MLQPVILWTLAALVAACMPFALSAPVGSWRSKRRRRAATLRLLAEVNAQLAERDADLLTLDSATVIRLVG